jgi:hypothetical protein
MPEFGLGIYDPEREARARETVYGDKPPRLTPAPPTGPLAKASKKDREHAEMSTLARGMISKHDAATRERELIRDSSYMATVGLGTVNPNANYEFEQSRDSEAEYRRQDFRQNDPHAAFLQPDNSLIDPNEEPGDSGNAFRSTLNFIFSDEMGMLGMKWDDEAFSWNKDNFINQITEHPYSTAFTLASYIVPVGLAWQKGSRIAQRGAKLAAATGADAAAVTGSGILGSKVGWRFDDHAKLVQTLAKPEANDGRRFFSDSTADALKKATSPDEIKDIVSPTELNKMLINDWHQERYFELRQLAKQGKLETIQQKAAWTMWRRFGNKYFEKLQDIDKVMIQSMDDFFVKSQIGRFLAQAPGRLGEESNQAIFKYWQAGTGNRNTAELAKKVGAENADWAERIVGKWENLFVEQYDEGFIDYATVSMFTDPDKVPAGFHLPAILKGTPGFEELGGKFLTVEAGSQYGSLVERRGLDIGKALTGPTTKHRGKFTTSQAVLDNLDELETNPAKLTIGGFIKDNILFQIHRNFRDIIVDATEGSTRWSQMIASREAYESMPKYAKQNWISFEDLDSVVPGLSERMERMVQSKVTKEGLDSAKYTSMPVIDREVVKKFFGREGSARQVGGTFGKFFELLTAVHKTSRTALNAPTHMSNITGNMMFLAMAGMNPFGKQALNDGRMFAKAFHSLAKSAGSRGEDTIDSLMTKDNLAKLFGDDRYATDKLGNKVDFAELFSDSIMKDLTEAQAFDEVEGLKNVDRLLAQLERLETDGWGDKALEATARAIAGVGEVPGIKQTLHAASSAYLAEDMIPKMMYAANLARKGWGKDAIIREVGRRLPQYRTVGSMQQAARRVVLPWITFPAEATRIMKNNMMDRPVQMMAWMQAPQIAQSIVSGSGQGPDFSEYEDAINAAPPWAVRYQTVMVDGNDAPELLGAVGGAGVAGTVGAAVGGARGAAIGAVAGGVAGAALGATFGQEQAEIKDFNRAWVMDFLPQSALFPSSLHPSQWEKVIPSGMGGAPVLGRESAMTAKDLFPVEPFAVFTPLLELYAGRGSFGREINDAKSGIDYAGKMALGLLGHLSPPIMQKYGMKLDDSNGNPIEMAEIFESNGGQSTLPRAITATFGGLALGGLSFLGAKSGLGVAAKTAAGSAALAGAIGAGAGHSINMSRLMEDLGLNPNPRTGQMGDMTLDFVANSFFGLNKSWRSDPLQAEYQQTLRNKQTAELRASSVKQFRDAITNGRASSAAAILAEIKKTYIYQYGDTKIADVEFIEWSQRMMRDIGSLPIYGGVSEKELVMRINALRAANAEKYKMQRARLAENRAEFLRRQLKKANGLKVMVE